MATGPLAHIAPELLVWARESINLTVEEAADRMDVPAHRLSVWETGKELPTIVQLRKAAAVYKRPLAAFFLPRPPQDFFVPHDFRRLPGEPAPTLSPELIVELRLAQFRQQLATELAEKEIKKPFRYSGHLSLNTDAETAAEESRRLLGISWDQQISWQTTYEALNAWKEAIERLGALIFFFGKVDVDEVRGYSISAEFFPVIGVNGKDTPNGRIFTLIHEFAHLLLNQSGSCNLQESPVSSKNQRIEVFCNHVAGAVLVPKSALEQEPSIRAAGKESVWEDWQLQELSNKFKASQEVVLRRILMIGKTTEKFYRKRRDQFNRAAMELAEDTGGFLEFPKRALRYVGKPFASIVLDAYHRDEITLSDVAEYLGVRPKHLSQLETALSGKEAGVGGAY
jgi:Zn-dependent peptidase ImmA (M78 family)